MKSSFLSAAVAALLAVMTYYFARRNSDTAKVASANLLEAIVGASMEPGKDMLTLAELTSDRKPPAEAEQALLDVRAKILVEPAEADLHAREAFILLESGFGSRPPSNEHMVAGEKALAKAQKLFGTAAKTADLMRAELALNLAKGETEAALPLGQELVELDGSVVSRAMWAKAWLAATCSKACAARHQEQLGKHAPEGAVFPRGKEPGAMASAHRAAGMYRVMEAGKVLLAAAGAHPTHAWAQAASKVSAKLRSLNTGKVSSSGELFDLAGCSRYEGVKLDGGRCPKDGEDPYERKRKLAAAKKKKKAEKAA